MLSAHSSVKPLASPFQGSSGSKLWGTAWCSQHDSVTLGLPHHDPGQGTVPREKSLYGLAQDWGLGSILLGFTSVPRPLPHAAPRGPKSGLGSLFYSAQIYTPPPRPLSLAPGHKQLSEAQASSSSLTQTEAVASNSSRSGSASSKST